MLVHCSIVLFYVMFAFSFALVQLNVKRREFATIKGGRILHNSTTTILTQIVQSSVVCSSLCSIQGTCCYASYDRKTKQCILDESCCPQSEPSPDALILKKLEDSLSCQKEWFNYESKCYYFGGVITTWNDAKLTCESYGSMMVEVKSNCENDFLKTKAATYKASYWLGGTDIKIEGIWIWSSSQTEVTFSDWNVGNPNNANDNEHCLGMNYGAELKWNDYPCSGKLRTICEKVTVVIDETFEGGCFIHIKRAHNELINTMHVTIKYRNFTKFNKEKFIEDLKAKNFNEILYFDNPDHALDAWYSKLLNVLNKHAPIITKRVKKKSQPKWLNQVINQLRAKRDFYHKKRDFENYKLFRNKLTAQINKCKTDYFSKAVQSNSKTSEIWKHLKDLNAESKCPITSVTFQGSDVNEPKKVCEHFNEHFGL
ncbi:unnamed protein product [Mytilus coruscus]|uniref:C-type lectin domain-containing protein n=1 Tax=Mytilus coruscus TaxID=42192 RepID=A0A6J8A8P5_MYTCO|nr:unnamed protein product [Mytilus coruscus]